VATVRAHPELAKEGQAAMYGMMAKIPVRGAVKMGVIRVMEAMHHHDGMKMDDGLPGSDDPLMDKLNTYANLALDIWEKMKAGTSR